MTPAVKAAKKLKLSFTLHEYDHDESCDSYGEEAAQKLGVDAGRVFKTLVVDIGGNGLAVAILPVSSKLSLKRFAKAAGVKKVVMADPKTVERVTGYVLGGVSPLGQKKRLKTVIHDSARLCRTLCVSAGRRGLEIELRPEDLRCATSADFADICS